MPDLSTIQNIVEDCLHQGIDDRDVIVRAASDQIEVDEEELRRVYFTKAVSFCITHIRDDMGKRLVYQAREGGKNLVVHLQHTTDFRLVGKIAHQKLKAAEALEAEGSRLLAIAEQIEIQFPDSNAA